MNMLIDHKQDIGLRYVEKVVVLNKDTTKKSRQFYFVLSFETVVEPAWRVKPA